MFLTSGCTSKAQNNSAFKSLTSKKLTCQKLIRSFVQMLLSSNLRLFEKENMSPQFNFIDSIEKLHAFF